MNDTFSEIELRKLDLNLLLTFSAIMRERSVTKAATRLYLGPSAISMALGRLRDELGDPLFVRSGTIMEPTTQALALWKGIEPALASIEQTLRSTRHFDPATATADVRVALPDDLEFVLLPRLLSRLAIQAPHIRLIVRPADFRTLLERVESGDADIALSAVPDQKDDRRFRHLRLHSEVFAVLYDPVQLDRTGDLDLDTWATTEQLFLTVSGDMYGATDEALAKIGRERQVSVGLSHFATAPFILKTRPCLINLPSIAAWHYAKAFSLQLSRTPIEVAPFEVALTWHLRTDADPLHAWLRRLISEEVMQLQTEARS